MSDHEQSSMVLPPGGGGIPEVAEGSMTYLLPFFFEGIGTGDMSAGLLLLALAILLIAILIDDDDLPGPRLYRVPADTRT